jgi:hypothetical protein
MPHPITFSESSSGCTKSRIGRHSLPSAKELYVVQEIYSVITCIMAT